MARVGQCLAQAPQPLCLTGTMQASLFRIAYPTFVLCFSSLVRGLRALLGQTFEQMVQSKLQKPFSKVIRGCIIPPMPYSIKAGLSTFEGHLLMQR